MPTPIVIPPTGPIEPVTSGPTDGPSLTPTGRPTDAPPLSDIRLAFNKVNEASAYVIRVETAIGRTVDRYAELFQAEPIESRRVEHETQAGTTRVVIIGERAWLAQPGQSFAPVPLARAQMHADVFSVEAVLEPYLGHDASATLRFVGRDARNGYETARYVADPELLQAAFPGAGQDASLTVWASEEGHLIALEAIGVESADRRVVFDAERIGDPGLVIEPPV